MRLLLAQWAAQEVVTGKTDDLLCSVCPGVVRTELLVQGFWQDGHFEATG